jgi:hypothetical protein
MLALSLHGAGISLFFLLFFATGANLCWRRLVRALPAEACTLLCEPGARKHAHDLFQFSLFFVESF